MQDLLHSLVSNCGFISCEVARQRRSLPINVVHPGWTKRGSGEGKSAKERNCQKGERTHGRRNKMKKQTQKKAKRNNVNVNLCDVEEIEYQVSDWKLKLKEKSGTSCNGGCSRSHPQRGHFPAGFSSAAANRSTGRAGCPGDGSVFVGRIPGKMTRIDRDGNGGGEFVRVTPLPSSLIRSEIPI